MAYWRYFKRRYEEQYRYFSCLLDITRVTLVQPLRARGAFDKLVIIEALDL